MSAKAQKLFTKGIQNPFEIDIKAEMERKEALYYPPAKRHEIMKYLHDSSIVIKDFTSPDEFKSSY